MILICLRSEQEVKYLEHFTLNVAGHEVGLEFHCFGFRF